MRGKNQLWLASAGILALVVGGTFAQDSTKKAVTPELLKAQIEALKPAKLTWREIAWKACLMEGLKESREKQRPIILWAFGNGDPKEERC
ncbi:hypothetical protein L0222_32840 [bacterium]|nr:hypothetical protein [bacterium]